MLSLGGVALASSASAAMLDKVAEAAIAEAKATAKRGKRKIDPATAVLLSDIHISGEFVDDKSAERIPKYYPYNPTCLKLRIAEILQMRPLPANVLVFGDVAWDYGLEEDYRYAAELLSELEQAGIKVTLGMGNHDRRAPFFKVFSEYTKSTKVDGRVVSVVEMPDFDFVMLDSLAELPGLKPRQATTVSGEISGGQMQRALLCRAIIAEPRLLILDEPTNFVDSRFESELYELLQRLNERMAIVMVSHDIGTITSIVKSIVCVNRSVHRHDSNIITQEQLDNYRCPIQIVSHGSVPHTVLSHHDGDGCGCEHRH